MRTMLRLLLVAGFLVGFGFLPASAQDAGSAPAAPIVDPERLAAARTLIELTRSDETTARILKQFSASFSTLAVRDNPAKQQFIEHMINDDIMPFFMAHLHEMQENSAMSYARNLSLEELQGIIDFYKSPIGQKYLDTVPKISSETTQANQPLIIGIVEQAKAKLKEDLRKNNLQVPKEMGL